MLPTETTPKAKKMKTIDEDTTLVPDNPIEEGIGMTLPHKGGATSYGKPQRWFQKNRFPRRK